MQETKRVEVAEAKALPTGQPVKSVEMSISEVRSVCIDALRRAGRLVVPDGSTFYVVVGIVLDDDTHGVVGMRFDLHQAQGDG